MKKSNRFATKLDLKLETARRLTTSELVGVQGGMMGQQVTDKVSCSCVGCGSGSGSNGGTC